MGRHGGRARSDYGREPQLSRGQTGPAARCGGEWETVPTEGNWFPDAFLGSMGSLQAFVAGASTELPTRVSDALDTMRTVEAAYISSQLDGQALPEVEG